MAKTIEAAKGKYIRKIKLAREEDKYVKGMARFLKTTPERIRDSDPVKNWGTFNIEKAADEWESGLKTAFGLKTE